MENEKLRALALIRASITEDAESIGLMLAEHPPTVELVRHLAAVSGMLLDTVMGTEQAIATTDRFLRATLEQESATRAREAGE